MSKCSVLLVDGSSYFYRAFHALPPLINSKRQPTGAVYGVANMIKKLIKETNPTYVAIVFDAKGKTFRDDWYPEYKAHRSPTPPDLSIQFEPLIELLRAMNLPILTIPGVEADDVIATLATAAAKEELSVLISTGDKDIAQLVDDHISLINTMSNQYLTIEGVKQKFDVYPHQIVDYLTLIGDTSDNIPGVHKCGPKTAAKWIQQYETLDNIMLHADDITGKVGEYLRDALPHLPLSKQLVTLKKDVELPVSLHELTPKPYHLETLIPLLENFEFKAWLKEFNQSNDSIPRLIEPPKPSNSINKNNYEIILEESALKLWLQKLNHVPYFTIDTETTNLDPMLADLVGISFSIPSHESCYIPLNHEVGQQLDKSLVLDLLTPILTSQHPQKVGHNIKFSYLIFKNEGITLQGILNDTMLESYVLNSAEKRHDLDSIAQEYLHYKTITLEELAGKGAKQKAFNQIPIEEAARYATEGADACLRLHEVFVEKTDSTLKNLLDSMEIPLITVLGDMEYRGVLIDADTLFKQGERLKKRLAELEAEALIHAGQKFNLNSPSQLQVILFDKLQLPIIAKTPTGQPSTGEAVLQELAFDYPLPKIILEYRSLAKLVSTYIDALPKCIHPDTCRLHTSYNQAVTATGRLSSTNPNLQNIPIRNEEGKLIRQAFTAPPEHVILSADYSQIELRIMAHLSNDPTLCEAFRLGLDIHQATASEIFHRPLAEVTPEERQRSKAINFGLIYGMSSFGLAKQIGVSRHEADFFINYYFERYPYVKIYMDNIRHTAREQGYVETLFGRRLYLPDINHRNHLRQKAAERAAINAPMQGTAADIIKRAMIAIHHWLNESKELGIHMVMQVHDELVFEVPREHLAVAQKEIKRLMETTTELLVPIEVSMGYGENWGEAH